MSDGVPDPATDTALAQPGTGSGQPEAGSGAPDAAAPQPAAGDQQPAGGEQQPAAGDQQPAGGEQRPAGEGQRPAGGEQQPAGEGQQPAGGEQQPAGDGQQPAGDGQQVIDAVAPATRSAAPLTEEVALDDLPAPTAEAAAADVVPDTSDLPPGELRAVVESLLFVATRPLTVERLQQCLPGTSAGYLDGFLAGLAERYDHENRGWELLRIAGGWQLLTRRQLHPWVRQLERKELPARLSKSALETLAIVAYKQPITRGQVEDIRGVQCGPVLRQLMDLKLVQVTGRAEDLLGRPLLYATTEHFLSRFGLGGLGDLPRKHEFGA